METLVLALYVIVILGIAATLALSPLALAVWLGSQVLLFPRRRLLSLLEVGPTWYDGLLESAAEDLGLSFRPRGFLRPPIAVGTIEGRPVDLTLELITRAEQQLLSLRLRIHGLPDDVSCRRADLLHPPVVQTGDPEFDAGVSFRSEVHDGLGWLPASTRHPLQEVVQAGGAVHDGFLELHHLGPELLGAAEVVALARRALEVARGLARGPVPIAELVTSDPDPSVRVFALERLLHAGPPDEAWLRELAAGDDVVAARAASALGDRDLLRRLLAGPAAREALVALAPMIREADPPVEAALARLVRRAPDPEVLAIAGRLGSVALVMDLLAVRGDHARAARRAVAEIQGRSIGLRGGLALVDPGPEAGRLAVAEARGGELAEVPSTPAERS